MKRTQTPNHEHAPLTRGQGDETREGHKIYATDEEWAYCMSQDDEGGASGYIRRLIRADMVYGAMEDE